MTNFLRASISRGMSAISFGLPLAVKPEKKRMREERGGRTQVVGRKGFTDLLQHELRPVSHGELEPRLLHLVDPGPGHLRDAAHRPRIIG